MLIIYSEQHATNFNRLNNVKLDSKIKWKKRELKNKNVLAHNS